jgi:hypothetical protein
LLLSLLAPPLEAEVSSASVTGLQGATEIIQMSGCPGVVTLASTSSMRLSTAESFTQIFAFVEASLAERDSPNALLTMATIVELSPEVVYLGRATPCLLARMLPDSDLLMQRTCV